MNRDGFDEGADDAQKLCQPSEEQSEVVAGGGKDDVDAVVEAAFETVALRAMFALDVADNAR
ncbi:hypothetical protein AOQ73_20995 [Bradyrhizobium pachyrhizi]|nr:hypothetical protein AOQ73_20995 [Bradyrhizobium pachyrhizi]